MKFEDALELAEYYYNGIKNRTARYFAEKLIDLIKEYPILKNYYTYNPDAWCWRESFNAVKKSLSNYEIKAIENVITAITGLYLVGSTYFNPYTDEKFYWIKVGKSTDLKKRMKQYATHNPMLWKNCFIPVSVKNLDTAESLCHAVLKHVALKKAENTNEWFQVDKETYLNICETGFEWVIKQIPDGDFREEMREYFK